MSATLLFLGKAALGVSEGRREKRRRRRRIRSLEEELDEETGGTCRKVCLTLLFFSLAVLAILFIFILYNIVFFIPNAILVGILWLLRQIWSSDFFIATVFSIASAARTIILILIAVWNPLSVLGPPLAALWNIGWDIIYFLLAGFFGLVCTGAWQDPGFNPLTNCPLLLDLLALSPILAEFLYDVIQVLFEIVGLIGDAMKAIVCFERVGAFIINASIFSNGAVIADCTWFCAEVAGTFDPSCYNFVNLIRWTFPANFVIWALRLAQFLSNLIDFTMPFWWDGMRWISYAGGVVELYTCQTLWCITATFWSDPLNITRKLVKLMYGITIDFGLAVFDKIGCTFFSSQFVPCIAHPMCTWMGLGVLCLGLGGGYCACDQCWTGWDKLFGWTPFISGAPCSLGCATCHYTAYLVIAALNLYNLL